MTRRFTAAALVAGLVGLLALDQSVSAPLNPYRAPTLMALGSGETPTGAHCATPPPG